MALPFALLFIVQCSVLSIEYIQFGTGGYCWCTDIEMFFHVYHKLNAYRSRNSNILKLDFVYLWESHTYYIEFDISFIWFFFLVPSIYVVEIVIQSATFWAKNRSRKSGCNISAYWKCLRHEHTHLQNTNDFPFYLLLFLLFSDRRQITFPFRLLLMSFSPFLKYLHG